MSFTTSVVDTTAGWLGRRTTSRRSFLRRTAVVGSAIAVNGLDFVLRPGTAYASVCGPGSSCASGWTALCCTINNGVNRCPPGSFAAGWWKADGASLCGGKARYYIDCQGRCTQCGCASGRHFCAERCWNCNSHCARTDSCDKRRVCSNLFRYGQCHQEIHCSGPVWCRVISCTPPWQFESCSRSSATDNATRDHSAPCVAHSWTPLQARYKELGSQGSSLGASIGPEHDGHVGRWQRFVHGRMFRSRATGAHFVLDPLAVKYAAMGQSRSPLGLPTTDTRDNSGPGRHNLFQHGSIYSSPGTGPHAVVGSVDAKWAKLGRAGGSLGLPITDTLTSRDRASKHNDFQHGAIYARRPGTFVVPQPALSVWHALHRERGPLGYPVSDPVAIGGNRDIWRLDFVHGTIDRHPELGNHAVWGPIFDAWAGEHGRETGDLGFPVSNVYEVDATHVRCDFERGSLVLDKTTGQVSTA